MIHFACCFCNCSRSSHTYQVGSCWKDHICRSPGTVRVWQGSGCLPAASLRPKSSAPRSHLKVKMRQDFIRPIYFRTSTNLRKDIICIHTHTHTLKTAQANIKMLKKLYVRRVFQVCIKWSSCSFQIVISLTILVQSEYSHSSKVLGHK